MRAIVPKAEGEVLRIGQSGERPITVLIDPRRAGSREFTMGVQELPPGGRIPMHRHQHEEEIMFIYAGRARVTVEGESYEVGPETAILYPQGAWHQVEAIGDGPVRMTWTFSPPGYEEVFREMARRRLEHAGPPSA